MTKVLGIDVGELESRARWWIPARVNLSRKENATPPKARSNGRGDGSHCKICDDLQWQGLIGIGFPAIVKNGVALVPRTSVKNGSA